MYYSIGVEKFMLVLLFLRKGDNRFKNFQVLWLDVGIYVLFVKDFLWCKMLGIIYVYGYQKFLDVEYVDGKIFIFFYGVRKLDQLVICIISYYEYVM